MILGELKMIKYEDVKPQVTWMCASMIPGDPASGMPSAADVDLVNTLLPNALKARSDLAPDFYKIISELPAEAPLNPLAVIEEIPVAQREVIGRFLAGAYFSAKEVALALRFPGFEAVYENVDYDEIMEAVEPIIDRGQHYIEVQ